MQAITIGTAAGIEELRQRLMGEFRDLQQEGVNIRVGESHRGNLTFLDCNFDGLSGSSGQTDALVRHYLANALTDVIVDGLEPDLLRKIIRGTYSYFSREEQDLIAASAQVSLRSGPDGGSQQTLNRRIRILHRLRDFLDSSDELVLEGFIMFRLQDYVEELEDAVDRAVDEFLMEREYREFVRLLKYFVDVQEPRIDHVHVLIRPGGSFRLVDDQGLAIRSEYLEEFVVEMVESEVNYDDLLISALITLAPRRITVHGMTEVLEDESLETITAVFAERVTLCEECPGCSLPAPVEDAPQAHHGR